MRMSSGVRSREPVGVSTNTLTRRSRVDGRRLTSPRLELAHGNRPVRLDQVQQVTLRRRELELGGERRQVRPLSEEQLRQQLPGGTLRPYDGSRSTLPDRARNVFARRAASAQMERSHSI